jgi:hypothetical protein
MMKKYLASLNRFNKFDISDLESGVYTYTISSGDKRKTNKLVIE